MAQLPRLSTLQNRVNSKKESLESDESFFHFNLSAVNHEKAKSLLHWQRNRDDRKQVRSKLKVAVDTLSPDLTVWKSYYYMTQARLEFADHDLEGSAQAAKAALRIAKAMHSQIEEANVRGLCSLLSQEAPNNPYVNNLGLELGIL